MKQRIVIRIIIGALLAAWIILSNHTRAKRIEAESQVETIQQQRAEATGMLLKVCTNEIPGIKNVVDISIDDSADLASKWAGRATVQYVNQLGGVERTNLFFTFDTAYGDLHCAFDAKWIHEQELNQLTRRLNAAASSGQ